MSWRLEITDEGLELRGPVRKKVVPWGDVAGFYLKEGGLRGGDAPVFWRAPDSGWVVVRGGDRFQLKGISTDEEILDLNRVLEERRAAR